MRAEYISPDANLAAKRAWGDMSTGGSRGIRGSVEYVRKGGAVARAMLISAAAARWNVPVADCKAALSMVTHTPTGRTLRYAEVAAEAAKLPVPADTKVKDPSQWTIIGQPKKRLDTVEKLSGKQIYAIDVKLPGMLCAAVAQCLVFGGKLVSFDASKIEKMPGVRHVLTLDEQTVAVVADKFYFAKTALAALPIVWDEAPNANLNSGSIAALFKTGLDSKDAGVSQKFGDVEALLAKATRTTEAVYSTPFLSHACLQPMNCTALYSKDAAGDRLEIWVPSQNGDAALAAAGEAGSVKLANVKVNKLHIGGGFGRKGQQDYTRQAVLIAKQLPGVPVKMIWTREEDMQHDFYRPITMAKMKAGLDADSNVTTLHARISGQSIRAVAEAAYGEAWFRAITAEAFG